MDIVFDLGSNFTKLGIFKEDNLLYNTALKNNEIGKIVDILNLNPDIKKGIISSVSAKEKEIANILINSNIPFIYLDQNTNIPIKNSYQSATLGKDRLAAAIGANLLYPKQNLLILDFGTAITIDFINKNNEYIGGNISPGLSSRFWVLNKKSDYLPLLKASETFETTGKTTESAIINGVQNGIIFEINSYINIYKKKYKNLKVIATGGDAVFFEKKLKNTIFVVSNLVLIGLHRILRYNEENH